MSHTNSASPAISQDVSTTGPLTWFLAALVGLFLIANIPLFVCMPLTDDAVLYDLQARNVLDGGILYRDFFEPNLPGIVWMHIAFRSAFGFSSEAIRLVDITIFAGIVTLLWRILRQCGQSLSIALGTSFLLVWFYVGLSEWCHCQRDMWLLLPALGALTLRLQQTARLASVETTPRQLFVRAIPEGCLWAAAFWIKPHIAIPGLACLIASAIVSTHWRRVLVDWSGVLLGGIAIGAIGIGWLWQSGAWPYFLDTLVEWNPRYVSAGKEHWTKLRFLAMSFRMFPWILLHFAALPIAIWLLVRIRKPGDADTNQTSNRARALLAAFYLGSLCHAFLLQHLFDYVHAPIVLLAIAVLAAALPPLIPSRKARYALTGFLFLAVIFSPPISGKRLATWNQCFAEGSSPAVRDKLKHSSLYDFSAMHEVSKFLSKQDLRDGSVVCFNNGIVSLYGDLNTRPGTRYIFLESISIYFPDRHEEFIRSLNQSNHQYAVTNLIASGMSTHDAYAVDKADPNAPPPAFPQNSRGIYPWSHPVVFRAGPYLVHQIERPLGHISVAIPRRHRQQPASPKEKTISQTGSMSK